MAAEELPPFTPGDVEREIRHDALYRECALARERARELCERSRELYMQCARLHSTYLGLRGIR